MDLHLVTYFVAVVDHGGISAAARELYLSQPSLSQAIRTLERRLGTTLFDRSGRGLVPTAEGRAFDALARRILADVDRAHAAVDAVRRLDSGRVDIVTYSAFSQDPTVGLVRRFRDRHPAVTVRIVGTDGPQGVLAALRRGEAEIGLTDLPVAAANLRVVPVTQQELVLALPSALAATLPDPVPRAALVDVPLIADLTDDVAVAHLRELAGTDPHNIVVDCAHPPTTWDLVAEGVGATIAPRGVAESERLGGNGVERPDMVVRSFTPAWRRPVGLVVRATPQTPAAAAFLATATAGVGTGVGPAVRADGADG